MTAVLKASDWLDGQLSSVMQLHSCEAFYTECNVDLVWASSSLVGSSSPERMIMEMKIRRKHVKKRRYPESIFKTNLAQSCTLTHTQTGILTKTGTNI